jgi:aspartyl-tRNA(Asn)/glutamyl-tRNA(Gln) amidotransferase subunit A
VRDCSRVFKDLGAYVESTDFAIAAEAQKLNSESLVISAEAYTVNQNWLENYFDKIDPLVSLRMINGNKISATNYLKMVLEWKRLQFATKNFFDNIDALIAPTTCIPALPISELNFDKEKYKEKNTLFLRNTAIGNILNLCGLSLPCGFTKDGMPIGLMIYGKPYAENTILRIGYSYQSVTDWHRQAPDLSWIKRPMGIKKKLDHEKSWS